MSWLFWRRQQPQRQPQQLTGSGAKKATLAGIVGAVAAAALLTSIPEEESGRKVDVTIAPDGTPTIRHLAGKQYLRAYIDIASVPTACDGITKGVRMGQTYTEAQCTAKLEEELIIHARGVMACSPGLVGPGREWQRVAAISFAYNVGVSAYCRSSVALNFNGGTYAAGCNALLKWDKARVGGVLRPVKGLTARRKRERAVCLRNL